VIRLHRWCLVALALVSCIFAGAARPVQAQYTDRTLVFGPLMLALDSAYARWVSGPLRGRTPEPAGFTVVVSAASDPYTIAFRTRPGHSIASAKYAIASSAVVDASWASTASSSGPAYSKGPLTLSGSYVRAYLAAYAAQMARKKALGDSYAFQNSLGSGVALATLPSKHGAILVGFAQTVAQRGRMRHIGCYKEQQVIVDPATFHATPTTMGCPG